MFLYNGGIERMEEEKAFIGFRKERADAQGASNKSLGRERARIYLGGSRKKTCGRGRDASVFRKSAPAKGQAVKCDRKTPCRRG